MENTTTWLLIADASQARIYSTHLAHLFRSDFQHNGLALIDTFAHPTGRERNIDFTTDKLGEFGRMGNRSTFGEKSTAKVMEAERFATQLAQYLELARQEHAYRDLILVAPPGFMGILQKQLTHETHKCIAKCIDKNYTWAKNRDLLQSLSAHL